MAIYNLDNYLEKDGLGFPLNFRRGNPNPLDNSSVWKSYEEAKAYAETNPVAYVGQPITVVTTAEDGSTSVTMYTIQNAAGDLEEVGKVTLGDDKVVEIIDGKITLVGIDEITDTSKKYQPILVDGVLTWQELSATTVEGLDSSIKALDKEVEDIQVTVGDAESGLVKGVADNAAAIEVINTSLADIYTKAQTDAKISEEVGKQSHFSAKIVASTDEMTDATVLYLVKDDTAEGADKYNEYILVDGVPTLIGDTTTNLDDYATVEALNAVSLVANAAAVKADVDAAIGAINTTVSDLTATVGANKTEADEAIAALQEVDGGFETRIKALEDVGSEKNFIAAASSEFIVTDDTRTISVNAIDNSKITGLSALLAEKIDKKDGYGLISSEDQEKLNKLTITDGNLEISGSVEAGSVKNLGAWITGQRDSIAGLFSTADETKLDGIETGAQVNVIEAITAAGTALSITDKTVNIAFATSNLAGLVKSAANDAEGNVAVNSVYVDSATGIGKVKAVNVNTLVQDDGDTLILHGGNA